MKAAAYDTDQSENRIQICECMTDDCCQRCFVGDDCFMSISWSLQCRLSEGRSGVLDTLAEPWRSNDGHLKTTPPTHGNIAGLHGSHGQCRLMWPVPFGSPFSSKAMVYGHYLVTLPLTVNQTLKQLHDTDDNNADGHRREPFSCS